MIKFTNFSLKIWSITRYYLRFLPQFGKFSLFFLSPYSCAKVSIIISILFIIPCSVSAFVTVGSDPISCTYDNLFDAYEDADVNVRVTSEQIHSISFTISKSKFFKGGYDDCTQANLDIVGQTKSKWSGLNSGVVLFINGGLATQSLISFTNFEIFDGDDTAANAAGFHAGGVVIFGKSIVAFVDSEIHNNTANEGGGVRINGEDAQLIINNTRVALNTAENSGGGIYCTNSSTVTIFGNSAINSNQAANNGGGIYADDCIINDSSGDISSGFDAQKGIYANLAKFGGGVYLTNGSVMTLTGNEEHPASIDFNFSTNENEQFSSGGGGIYMTGAGTTLDASNAKIINNFANTGGAGIVVLDSAQFSMNRLDTPCWNNDKCSELSNNVVLYEGGIAGAGYIAGGSSVNIAQTFIDNNKARAKSIFDIRQSHVVLEGNLITNHKANTSPIVSNSLFSLGDSSRLDFYYNTLSNNNGFRVFELKLKTEQELNVYNSIIWDNGDIFSVIDNSGASFPLVQNANFNCNFVHETNSFTADVSVVFSSVLDPNFVDSENGNYHLAIDSLAQDLCNEDSIQSQYLDLNGFDRGVDYVYITQALGVFDAGAYESQNAVVEEVIFSNDFE